MVRLSSIFKRFQFLSFHFPWELFSLKPKSTFSGKKQLYGFCGQTNLQQTLFFSPRFNPDFSVFSISGCSGFFKRSIHRNRVYTCKAQGEFKGKCPIDKTHRNQCRACRLRKCFESAMNRDGRSLCSKLFVLNHVSSSNSRVQWTQRPNKGFKLTASSRYNDMLL